MALAAERKYFAIAIVNPDLEFSDPNVLFHLTTALAAREDLVACSPLVHNPDCRPMVNPRETNQVRRIPNYSTLLLAHSWWLSRIFYKKTMQYTYGDILPFKENAVLSVESINGACFLIKSDFLISINLLDEGTFLYGEEIILGKQIQEAGKACALVTSALVLHHQGSSTGEGFGKFRLKRRIQAISSELHYCSKYLNANWLKKSLLVLTRAIDITTKYIIFHTMRCARW